MTRSAVLINPVLVRRSAALPELIHQLLREVAWPEPSWIETDPRGSDEGQLRQAVRDGAEVVFACGGDGTVMTAVQVLAQTTASLAVIPLGSGNLLARNLGIPRDPRAAIRLATQGTRRRIDLGEVDGRLFAVAAGMGLDAQMLADAPRFAKRLLGWIAYVPAGLRHLPESAFTVQLTIDNQEPMLRRVRSVVVANVGILPGGLALLPSAAVDDGVLDTVMIGPRRLAEWMRVAIRLGIRHPDGAGMESFRGTAVEVVTDLARPREADGEPLPSSSALVVRIRPNALRVCVPWAPP